jgi:AcrR family transcriptional regulator
MSSQAKAEIVAARSRATRQRIVDVARALVVEQGYEGLTTAELLRRAGVSRGGLYHHFAGKAQLIAAVLEALERDLIARLTAAVAGAPGPMRAIEDGAQWYLDECVSSVELQRIGLIEGRKALGWEAWREVVAPHGLTLLTEAIGGAIEAGEMESTDPAALSHLLLAALHEASAVILSAPDRHAERERTGRAVANLIRGLRPR